jgi:hypothetical protein
MTGNEGFQGLHNLIGAISVVFATLLFIAIIIFGSLLVKAKMGAEKEVRAELRRQLEARNNASNDVG